MAGRKKTGNVTLKDIAQATGFSANTVSRALADKPDISQETKEIIRARASEMGYIANALASFLRSGVSRNIAIIVGDISNPHFSVMVKEMQTMLQRKGYNSIIFNTEEKAALERQAITTSLSQNVDGIILCPAPGGEANRQLLFSHKKPVVLIGRHYMDSTEGEGMDASYVVCDDVHGGYAATRYLLERGHRRILFLNGPRGISSSVQRLEGYQKAMKEAGEDCCRELVHSVPDTPEVAIRKMKDILANTTDYTAVLVFSDILAWQTVCILDRMGKSVPRDCSVVGFDNIKYPYPVHLTSVSSSKTTMAKRCVEILLHELEGNPEKQKVVLETDVVEGMSVAGPDGIKQGGGEKNERQF